MKKVKLTRSKMLAFLLSATNYSKEVGVGANKLVITAEKVMDYDPNVEVIEQHNKAVKKMHKQLERDCRDISSDYAVTKDGSLVRDKDGNYTFTPENQKKADKLIDGLNDKYADELDAFMATSIEFYIPTTKVTVLPENLAHNYRKGLSLLID